MMNKKQGDLSVQDILLKKTGKAAGALSERFLLLSEGERIPTVSQLSESSGFSRGTIQNALGQLVKVGAVEIESHGHLGTFLKHKDTCKLIEAMGRQYISVIMPMPYTKAYEGLATGLFNSITASGEVSADIAYMRGSRKRITSLIEGKYDFAVVSKYAVKLARNDGINIDEALDFGPSSYLAGHVMAFRSAEFNRITPGLRVGIDPTSYDHEGLTKTVVGSVPVKYINVNYGQILSLLQDDVIDAALCNRDQLTIESSFGVLDMNIDEQTMIDEVSAVLAVRGGDEAARALVSGFVDIELVKRQQKEVMSGERYPNY